MKIGVEQVMLVELEMIEVAQLVNEFEKLGKEYIKEHPVLRGFYTHLVEVRDAARNALVDGKHIQLINPTETG
jgi:hypothetical protein